MVDYDVVVSCPCGGSLKIYEYIPVATNRMLENFYKEHNKCMEMLNTSIERLGNLNDRTDGASEASNPPSG